MNTRLKTFLAVFPIGFSLIVERFFHDVFFLHKSYFLGAFSGVPPGNKVAAICLFFLLLFEGRGKGGVDAQETHISPGNHCVEMEACRRTFFVNRLKDQRVGKVRQRSGAVNLSYLFYARLPDMVQFEIQFRALIASTIQQNLRQVSNSISHDPTCSGEKAIGLPCTKGLALSKTGVGPVKMAKRT